MIHEYDYQNERAIITEEPVDYCECHECDKWQLPHEMVTLQEFYPYPVQVCQDCADEILNHPDNDPDEWREISPNVYKNKHSYMMRKLAAIMKPQTV